MFPGSTLFGLRFSDTARSGSVRFVSGINRIRFGRFGSLSHSFPLLPYASCEPEARPTMPQVQEALDEWLRDCAASVGSGAGSARRSLAIGAAARVRCRDMHLCLNRDVLECQSRLPRLLAGLR